MLTNEKRRKAGSKLLFDREAALRLAVLQFSQHGYEATSVGDLAIALGVNTSSI
jgi:AcrR family transcriptional regulator